MKLAICIDDLAIVKSLLVLLIGKIAERSSTLSYLGMFLLKSSLDMMKPYGSDSSSLSLELDTFIPFIGLISDFFVFYTEMSWDWSASKDT